jgi:transposase
MRQWAAGGSSKRGLSSTSTLIPLTVPEVRRWVLALREAEERRSFRLGWSQWRRAHQAVAARCHAAQRAQRMRRQERARPRRTGAVAIAAVVVGRALTDTEWQRIWPLLPPQRPPSGRPRHDHRTVLNGIVSVLRSGASWREMPQEYGKSTASGRLRTSAIGSGVTTGAGRASWQPWIFQRRPVPHLREWPSVTVGTAKPVD